MARETDVCTLTRKHSERSAFSQCQKETLPTLCNGGFAEGSARGVVRTALLGVSCILAVDPRLTFNQNQSLGTPSGPHSHSCKIQVWWGLWGNTGPPPPRWGGLPGGTQARGHSLLTGLHQLYEVSEEDVAVPLAEAIDVVGDLEGGDIGGVRG